MFERLQGRWKRSFGNKEQPWSVRPVEPQVLGARSVLGCDVFRDRDSNPDSRYQKPLSCH